MLHKMQLEWEKSQEILPSGAQRSFRGDVCFQHPHLMYQTHPRTIKGDAVTSGIFLLHVSLCVCDAWATAHACGLEDTSSCPLWGCQDWIPVLRLGSKGLYSQSPLAGPSLPTFLKTITVTGREAGKGPPAWGEVRLRQHYIHEQFEKTNTSQAVLKAQTRLAILFFHPYLLFQSCPPPCTPCTPLYPAMYGAKT